jgi:cyclopropane fatty-acyl-phospholipid synthase-like methyltransferase
MLNFGYWDGKTSNLVQAQNQLCILFGKFAELDTAKSVLDVGSGFSEPAIYWKSVYNNLDITCLDVNFLQLKTAAGLVRRGEDISSSSSSNTMNSKKTHQAASLINRNSASNISLLNGTAKILPLRDGCIDRVIALECAQHFKPLIQFIEESKRVLRYDDGLLVVAIPVTTMAKSSLSSKIRDFMRLGILSITWTSEHYELEYVKSLICRSGFRIIDIQHIGSYVYGPLADYYAQNRKIMKSMILNDRISTHHRNILYTIIERVVYNSSLKMKEAFQNGFIDYVLIKAKLS